MGVNQWTPNIEALLQGAVSGQFSEWQGLRTEVAALITERNKLQCLARDVYGALGPRDNPTGDLDDDVRNIVQAHTACRLVQEELNRLRAQHEKGKWRVGGKVSLNVYEDDAPRFQCHTPEEAARVVTLLNRAEQEVALIKDRDRLRASVRNQAGDNLCWLDNSGVTKIPEQVEFLESCRRYHAQVSGNVGVLDSEHMTIAQLEAEVDRLKSGLEDLCSNYNALVEVNSQAQGEVIRLEGLVASLRRESTDRAEAIRGLVPDYTRLWPPLDAVREMSKQLDRLRYEHSKPQPAQNPDLVLEEQLLPPGFTAERLRYLADYYLSESGEGPQLEEVRFLLYKWAAWIGKRPGENR